MPFPIEILSLGEDNYASLEVVAKSLNSAQAEFQFNLPPLRLRELGLPFHRDEFHTREVFDFLKGYKKQAKGHRPYLIAVVNGQLRSESMSNLFGSHAAQEGLAVFTLRDQALYTNSKSAFVCYYYIRYALSFLAPKLISHPDTRTCFFDRKLDKRDLLKSLETGSLCDPCRTALQSHFNPEVYHAVVSMVDTLKILVSKPSLSAATPTSNPAPESVRKDFATLFTGSRPLEDGTNVAAGTPFQEEFTTRILPWYIPANGKGTRNWEDNFAKLRTRFDSFIDEHCTSECFLVQTLIPAFDIASTKPPGILPDRQLLWSGPGLRREPANLSMSEKPLAVLFPIMNVRGEPMLRLDGSPAPFRLGLSRYISVYAIPDGLRPLPIPKLTELIDDGRNLLYQLPPEIAVKIWRNWPFGFSQRDAQALWLDALFEMSWQRERGGPFHTERYAWVDNGSVALSGKGLFPRLPRFITSTPSSLSDLENAIFCQAD